LPAFVRLPVELPCFFPLHRVVTLPFGCWIRARCRFAHLAVTFAVVVALIALRCVTFDCSLLPCLYRLPFTLICVLPLDSRYVCHVGARVRYVALRYTLPTFVAFCVDCRGSAFVVTLRCGCLRFTFGYVYVVTLFAFVTLYTLLRCVVVIVVTLFVAVVVVR